MKQSLLTGGAVDNYASRARSKIEGLAEICSNDNLEYIAKQLRNQTFSDTEYLHIAALLLADKRKDGALEPEIIRIDPPRSAGCVGRLSDYNGISKYDSAYMQAPVSLSYSGYEVDFFYTEDQEYAFEIVNDNCVFYHGRGFRSINEAVLQATNLCGEL